MNIYLDIDGVLIGKHHQPVEGVLKENHCLDSFVKVENKKIICFTNQNNN